MEVIGRPKSVPRIIQIIVTIIVFSLPFGILYYSIVTDIALDPIDVKEHIFTIPDQETNFFTIPLGKLFLNTEIFLYAEKNQTNGTPVEILLLDSSSYNDILDGDRSFSFYTEGIIILQNDLISAWNNVSVSRESSFYLIIQEISPGAPVTITISYWLEYPTLIQRDLLGIFSVVGGAYLLLFFGRRLLVNSRLKRARNVRTKLQKKEDDEYSRKIKQDQNP